MDLRIRAMRPLVLIAACFIGLSVASVSVLAQGTGKTPPPKPPVRDTFSTIEREQLREASRDARSIARRRFGGDSVERRARADSAKASAFATPEAQAILERARVAREQQDSALTAYKATTTQRMSAGMGVRNIGLEKLLFRGDNVAQVAWRRGVGVWVNPIGSRITVPMAKKVDGNMTDAVSIPYFPGRETLWFPSSEFGVVKTDVDERDMIHPLARGAEYYYRYETGDSVDIKLPGGRVIKVRELRITARRPDWKLFVGSFWFDREGGQLVRAAYRMAVDMEIWDVAKSESRADYQENRETAVVRDSIARARLTPELYKKDSANRARNNSNRNGPDDDDVPAWVSGTFRPAKASLDAISVEYGLYEGRFWLPRANSATATMQLGFMRVPFRIDEKFVYDDVNGDFTLPALPEPRTIVVIRDSTNPTTSIRDTIRLSDYSNSSVSVSAGIGGGDSTTANTSRADSTRGRRGPQAKIEQCKTDSTWTRVDTRYEGALRVAYAMPCDETKLSRAPELPPAYAPDEELFDTKSRDELLATLDMSLQPGFAPQMPTFHTGSDVIRYNRIEGLSLGVMATQVLGAGYTASALARIGHADLHMNGELSLARSNGLRTVTGTVYHRLNAMNPEWAGALSLGPSLPAFLYTRDEGFYYRSMGFEIGETRERRRGLLAYRLFVEREWTAGDSDVVNTFSLGRVFGDRRFRRNVLSEPSSVTGLAASYSRGFGNNPTGLQFATISRAEAGTGTFEYARASIEGTLSRTLSRVAVSLTGSSGYSWGDLPVQRQWYVGGLRTVRGQIAGTQSGDAYWLGRAEIGTRNGFFRPVGFFDVGWAGSRDQIGKTLPQRGAGFGVGLLDGLLRIDVSRGLNYNKRWRTDLYLGAPI